jgi:putative flavoprotein involved in K+ transport
MSSARAGTVVIGGGQAGLAAAYHLSRRNRSHVVLDAGNRVGDAWRRRWDSLRLFTPAGISHLPGMAFPAPASHLPTKDEMADYLEAYADRFQLPVQLRSRVEAVTREDDQYVVHASDRRMQATNVIVAVGAYPVPRVPSFADQLDPRITQLHSAAYHNPGRLPEGPVLVVGVGNSGAEIAVEIARHRPTLLSGRDIGYIRTGSGPIADIGHRLGSRAFASLASLSTDTWLGRRLVEGVRQRPGGHLSR